MPGAVRWVVELEPACIGCEQTRQNIAPKTVVIEEVAVQTLNKFQHDTGRFLYEPCHW
jgi:hypothetical protein